MTPVTRIAQLSTTVTGLAAALLFAGGSAIWGLEMPEDGTAVGEVVRWYGDTADRIVVGGSLSVVAIALFVAFAASVRQVLVEAGGDEAVAMTAFGGGLVVVVAGLGAETINMAAALRAQDGELTAPLAQALFEISQLLGSVAVGVGVGVFAIAVGEVALRTRGLLPRPAAVLVVVLGVACLTPLAHLNWLASAALVVVALVVALGVRRAPTR